MNRKNYPVIAIAVAVAVLGAIWAGVPASTLVIAALLLACPLMMVFMHGGHGGHGAGGGHTGHGTTTDQDSNAKHHHDPAGDHGQPGAPDPFIRR